MAGGGLSRRRRSGADGAGDRPGRDPWRRAPTSELQDQVLPRWFALTAVIMVPVALLAVVGAFVVFGPREVPVAERRPPPAGGFTNAVGDLVVGESPPVEAEPACPPVAGIRVAGMEADREALVAGLTALCQAGLGGDRAGLVEAFGEAEGVVRFAQFEDTGVDSTAALDQPLVLVNARFSVTDPAGIAPLIVHDLVVRDGDAGAAETALAARQAEAETCAAVFTDTRPSRACDDAAALLAAPDPLAALRAAGYR